MKKAFSFLISFGAGLLGAMTYQYVRPDAADAPTARPAVFEDAQQGRPDVFATAASPLDEADDSFMAAAARVTPAVVYIKNTAGQQVTWFDWFFSGASGQRVSTGSGVICSADGYIVTNNHVIDKASTLEVIHGKRAYPAQLVGTDPATDLAVLKVTAQNLPAMPFGSSRDLRVGEWVLAVGNPFNLNSTVTAGIVSAKGRNIRVVNSQFPIESFIQTDAAINPGNSGGALVNRRGELIGINTAIYSQTGSYTGYGFAVPSDIVTKVVRDLIAHGEVQKPFCGADVEDITPERVRQARLDSYDGVIVSYLERGGAAERAGLQMGDVVLAVNDEPTDSRGRFDEEISYFYPGDEIELTYLRDGRTRRARLTLTNREGTTEVLRREIYQVLGADMEVLSKVERNRLGIEHGVRVLRPGQGLIRRMGIAEGFIITAINREPVRQPEDVEALLGRARGKTTVEGVNQKGVQSYYTVFIRG